MPKTLKTFALHERLSRGRLPGKVFHGGQRKTSAWSWLHGKTSKTSASGSLPMQLAPCPPAEDFGMELEGLKLLLHIKYKNK
jgi:hypothetical protein